MTYGDLGQPKPGHLRSVSKNPKSERGGQPPKQDLRGYGGAASRNTTDRGRPTPQVQRTRGHRQTPASNASTKNTSAGRIRRIGGKGR